MDATTTITINGAAGDRFLTSLARYAAPVPRALRWLATSAHGTIAVGPDDAELVARFVDDLLASGWIAMEAPPLLFSPRVGETVVVHRDVLVETSRQSSGAPIVWRLLEAGTRGTLVGWRDRPDEEPRAVIELSGELSARGRGGRGERRDGRLVVVVAARNVTRAPRRRAVSSR
jgi:hypothetical protein